MINAQNDTYKERQVLYDMNLKYPIRAKDIEPEESARRAGIIDAACNDYEARVGKRRAEKEQVVSRLCRHLSPSDAFFKTATVQAAESLSAPGLDRQAAASFANSSQQADLNTAVVAKEASGAPPAADQWFAVVGTVPLGQDEAARTLQQSLSQALKAKVWTSL